MGAVNLQTKDLLGPKKNRDSQVSLPFVILIVIVLVIVIDTLLLRVTFECMKTYFDHEILDVLVAKNAWILRKREKI